MSQEVRYYQNYDQDFAATRRQDFKIPANYQWVHKNIFYRFFASLLYLVVIVINLIYMKLVAHVSIKNRRVLRQSKGGYYIYSNHTLLFGDVVNPFCINFPKHPYIICSPSNLGIPVLGKLLPMAGALPIPDNLHDMAKFSKAVSYRINQGNAIIIYPEEHLWPFYTKIRPLHEAAFHYPIKTKAPVYVATTTYQKSRFYKKPKITIYLDGPFTVDQNLSRKDAQTKLQTEVEKAMQSRAKLSTYEFISYQKRS